LANHSYFELKTINNLKIQYKKKGGCDKKIIKNMKYLQKTGGMCIFVAIKFKIWQNYDLKLWQRR
jgi:hypothetical protein